MQWAETKGGEVFDDVRYKFCIRPMNCEVKCFDCDGWKPQTMHISNLAS